jgi:hypothetical protein
MAGKKPAKAIAGQSKQQVVLDPAIYGISVKYIGTKSSPCSCGECGRNMVRGMIRLRMNDYFCSEVCAFNSHLKNTKTQESTMS